MVGHALVLCRHLLCSSSLIFAQEPCKAHYLLVGQVGVLNEQAVRLWLSYEKVVSLHSRFAASTSLHVRKSGLLPGCLLALHTTYSAFRFT